MKIKTFQEGSRIFAPTYNQFEFGQPSTTSQSSSRSQTKSDKDNDFIGKDLMKSLIGKGITNDVNASIQALMSIQETYQNMSDFEKSSLSGISVLNEMLQQSGKVNQLLRNAELFKQGQDLVVKNNAMNDVAISGRLLMLQDRSGKLLEMSPEEYLSLDKDEKLKYRPLTNAQLIDLREYSPVLLNDTLSFVALNNNASLQSINTQLKDIMSTITSSKVEESYDSYTDPKGELQKGLQILKTIAKAPVENIIQTISVESNDKSATLVLNSMWQSLSESSKTLLKSRAALGGLDLGELEQALQAYLIKMLEPKLQTNTSITQKVDLASKSGSKSGSDSDGTSGGADDKSKITGYWDGFLLNINTPQTIPISPFGGGVLFEAKVSSYGPMRKKTGEVYNTTPLSQISELSGISFNDAASFGGTDFISNTMQAGIMYNGADAKRGKLPYKMKDGQLIVDFSLLPKYQALLTEIEQKTLGGKKLSISETQSIYTKHGIKDLAADGTPSKLKHFFMTSVYVGEEIYDILDDESKEFLQLVDDPGATALMMETFKGKPQKGVYSDGDEIYQGIIYIPLREGIGVSAGVFNDGADLTVGAYKQRNTAYQTQAGIINKSVSQPLNMDLVNQQFYDRVQQ